MKLTTLKGTIRWQLVHSQCCTLLHVIAPDGSLVPIKWLLPIPTSRFVFEYKLVSSVPTECHFRASRF